MLTLTKPQTKKELRIFAKKVGEKINSRYIGERILSSLKNTVYYRRAENIFTFYPTGFEPDTSDIFKDQNKNFFIPRIYGKEMKMSLFDENYLVKNKYGILESETNIFKTPEKDDLILVPALAADKNFNRLGHGCGFYDKFLKNIDAFKLVIISEKLIFDDVFSENHDEVCDGILTEKNFYLRET